MYRKIRLHDDFLDDESESGFPLTTTFIFYHSCITESSYLLKFDHRTNSSAKLSKNTLLFSSIFAAVFCALSLKDELKYIDKHMSDSLEEDNFHV